MHEGLILGRPPVAIRANAGRQLLLGLMRGVTSYQAAAGFGGAPLAMPALQRFAPPASRQADPTQAHLYTMKPGLRKQHLQRIGASGEARHG